MTKQTPPGKASRPRATMVNTGRVRAAGLSRDRIVKEAVRYLREHPQDKLTIARAAAAAGATTMAVYRHFRDGAGLAEAIVDEVLENVGAELPRTGDWRVRVRAWMDVIFERFLQTPQSVELLNTSNGLSVAWISASSELRGILSAGGLRDPELTDATFWISMTMIGFVQHVVTTPDGPHVERVVSALRRLDTDGTSELSLLADAMPRVFAQARMIMFTRILASIEVLMADTKRSK